MSVVLTDGRHIRRVRRFAFGARRHRVADQSAVIDPSRHADCNERIGGRIAAAFATLRDANATIGVARACAHGMRANVDDLGRKLAEI